MKWYLIVVLICISLIRSVTIKGFPAMGTSVGVGVVVIGVIIPF